MRLGKYEALIELATGGMATVYVARQIGAAGFERLVAIKRVHPHLLRDPEFSEMFRDEARVSSLIRHANVVSATDVVEADGELFLVLDYVESASLATLMRAVKARGERIPPPIVSCIVSHALSGLHAAHEAVDIRGQELGIIHRDVNPANVIVGVDGASRLVDFGVAKAAARLASTQSGNIKGKLCYMSPEQVRQKPLDRRADLFGAGVMLFEALTGLRLFTGEDEADIALNVLIGTVPTLASKGLDLGGGMERVIEKALAREPEERFQTAVDFRAALEEALPPATPHAVAEYLESILGESLAHTRRQLRAALQTGARPAARARRWPLHAALASFVVMTTFAVTLASRRGAAPSETREEPSRGSTAVPVNVSPPLDASRMSPQQAPAPTSSTSAAPPLPSAAASSASPPSSRRPTRPTRGHARQPEIRASPY